MSKDQFMGFDLVETQRLDANDNPIPMDNEKVMDIEKGEDDPEPTENPQPEEKMIKILTEEEMEEKWDELDKDEISKYQKMSPDFIEKHKDELNWTLLSTNPQSMNFEVLDRFQNLISWTNISLNAKNMTDEFMYNYSSKLNWDMVFAQRVPNLTLRIRLAEKYRKTSAKNKGEFWSALSRWLELELSFIDIYKRYIDFHELTKNKHLTDEIIDKYIDELDLHTLVRVKRLSKVILQKYSEKLAPYCTPEKK